MTGRVDESFLSRGKFSEVPRIHPGTVQALDSIGYQRMSVVQSLAIPPAISGEDVVAKAQTGTGKTIAFLVPLLQVALSKTPGQVSGLILAPTRELAIQIQQECGVLTKTHGAIRCVVMVGGTPMPRDQRAFATGFEVLVATPGRLLDHLKNTPAAAPKLKNLAVFVLDEADRMLDMGFRDDLERIISYLPAKKQTLLFSATIAQDVIDLAPKLLAARFAFVDAGKGKTVMATAANSEDKTVSKLVADDPFVTAKQVTQHLSIVEQDATVLHVVNTIQLERKRPGHKIIVYCVTARMTQLFAELLEAIGAPVLEIHSRKSQSHRQKTSDRFRAEKDVVMLSSDVTARGMDYPDVSLVLQVGLPSSPEQYVHRLGRTGRAGMSGRGMLTIMPEEQFFVNQLAAKNLKLQPAAPTTEGLTAPQLAAAMHRVNESTRAMAYSAWLGFYNSFCSRLKWSKEYLVQRANQLALASLGFTTPPPMQKKTVGKMGLKGVPGLVLEGAPTGAPHQPRRAQPGAAAAQAHLPTHQVPHEQHGHRAHHQGQGIHQPAQHQPQQGGGGGARGGYGFGGRGGGGRGTRGGRGARGGGRGFQAGPPGQ